MGPDWGPTSSLMQASHSRDGCPHLWLFTRPYETNILLQWPSSLFPGEGSTPHGQENKALQKMKNIPARTISLL